MAAVNWNSAFEGTPAGSDNASTLDDRIQELKENLRNRLEKEIVWAVGTPTQSAQGWMKEGSAKAYYESSEPTNRPDASTGLDSDDAGRLWIDSDDGTVDYWDGDSFEDLQVPFADVTGTITASQITELDNSDTLKVKVIQIGDWNMDSSITVNVAHGISSGKTKIRDVRVAIIADDSSYLPLDRANSTGSSDLSGGVNTWDDTNISLQRMTGGTFDSSFYNATSFNRGWVTIWYEE